MASSSENTGAPLEEEQPQAPPTPNPEPSEVAPGEVEEEPQTLERAQELFDRGAKAIDDEDFVEAVDCLSQALEIRLGFPFPLRFPLHFCDM
jgi:nuclear autoantigenic sperm protein